MNYKRLGDYMQLVDNRNTDATITNLLGINITKNFMPSVANVSGIDLSKYKIIQKGQFAYSAMQVGRDETVRVALHPYNEPAIISPAYLVFKVIDETYKKKLRFSLLEKSPLGKVTFKVQKQNIVNMLSLMAF